jgi:hypothetical protein
MGDHTRIHPHLGMIQQRHAPLVGQGFIRCGMQAGHGVSDKFARTDITIYSAATPLIAKRAPARSLIGSRSRLSRDR